MFIRRFVVFSILSALILPTTGDTQTASRNENIPLVVSLSSDRKSGKIGDSVVLTITVSNVSDHPVFLYAKLNWGLSSSLFLLVEDDKGADVPRSYFEDALPPTASLKDKTLFIKLNPAHFFGTTRIDKLSDLVPKPGTYYLHLIYHGPVSSRFAAGSPAWGTEDPPISSNKIRIDVE